MVANELEYRLLFRIPVERPGKGSSVFFGRTGDGLCAPVEGQGFPGGLEMFLNVAAFNLFLLMFQSYGIAEGAAAAIVFNWDILSFVPMIGLHVGVISLIGRFVGARDMARTNEVMTAAFTVALAYSAMLAIVYSTYRYPLVEVFAPPSGDFTAVRELAAFMMIGLSSYVMADAVILVSGGILRGAGDTRWLMVASVSLHWAMLVAQFFILTRR